MNNKINSRREFVKSAIMSSAALSLFPAFLNQSCTNTKTPIFKISLGQWSLHRAIRNGSLDPLDFPVVARKEYGVDGVEYVNQLFMDKAKDMEFLRELKKRSDDNGVKNLGLMVDQEGALGDSNKTEQQKAVENHFKWVEAGKYLGCHSVRVNAFGTGSFEEQMNQAAEGLTKLTEFAADMAMNIIVENHGGLSSRGDWLAGLMKKINHKNCGTMPDFDNFQVSETERYDRYKGMEEIMPWAKSVSTKAHDFDENGNETTIDYKKMFRIVLDAGYNGYVSAEYEGERLSEPEGIKATINLMERVRKELS